MAFSEVTMLEIKEILRLWLAGVPKTRIAQQLGFDVKTVRRVPRCCAGTRGRAGGLINKWKFTDALVKATYEADCAAGVDYMEIGYKASKSQFDPKEFGKWRFCEEDDVKRVLGGTPTGPTKLACTVDIGRVDEKDLLPQKDSPIDSQ